jgi:hypothetical protein
VTGIHHQAQLKRLAPVHRLRRFQRAGILCNHVVRAA